MRFLLLLAMTVGLVAGVFLYQGRFEARLVRADPDSLVQDPTVMRVAIDAGAPQYQSHCASCHGATGQGSTERSIPNLRDQDWLYGSGQPAELERIVEYGIRSHHPKAWNLARMPAYARAQPSATEPNLPPLGPGQIRDVVEYLHYLQQHPADDAAAVRGAKLYGDVGGCYDCHGADARGDPAIGAPNLTDAITLYGDGGRQALFDSIAYGRQGVCPAWIGKITAAGIREIALYVYSLSHQEPARAAQPEANR
ncbi:MAG: c-type cytochrome [Pseudomonadota bacterium]|nr:c-type cytochrome [Pseudomonadota bacterium]